MTACFTCTKCKSCVSVALSVQKALGLASEGAAACNVPSSGEKMGSRKARAVVGAEEHVHSVPLASAGAAVCRHPSGFLFRCFS